MSATGSLIALIASVTGTPCDKVFSDAVLNSVPAKSVDAKALAAFSEAACRTRNPDAIWQLAFVESRFRFGVVRINRLNKVLDGRDAEVFLSVLDATDYTNVDIGALQVNYKWHHKSMSRMGYTPSDFINRPETLVNFVASELIDSKVARCGDRWVACYHSADPERGAAYTALYDRAGRILARSLAKFAKANIAVAIDGAYAFEAKSAGQAALGVASWRPERRTSVSREVVTLVADSN